MTLDSYTDAVADLEPADGEVESTELVVEDDVLVKA
ncbi:MAG: cupin, partial [Natronococcus sp.]